MGKGMIIHLIEQELETNLTLDLAKDLLEQNFNASNTVIVTVSTDYSSNVGQLLRHALSFGGEICDGFGIDVPYPDEFWDERYIGELIKVFDLYKYKLENKKILFVEAGVIRGYNYKYIQEFLRDHLGITEDVFFLALFENKNSKFKSDFVGDYYDNETQDLTFWWEQENNHWT
jgi:hypothetical protein